MSLPFNWKIKTKKYNETTSRFSFDSLKYQDDNGKNHIITFNFGYLNTVHEAGINVDVVQLAHEYEIERQIVEKICKLSDEGYAIVSNKEVIFDRFEGSKFLIDIDIKAPTYANLDRSITIPF